jgi:hypothetical protein
MRRTSHWHGLLSVWEYLTYSNRRCHRWLRG